MALVTQIARQPHPPGSAEHEAVKQYLFRELVDLGLRPIIETHTGIAPAGWADLELIEAAKVSNVVARLPGTANTRAVVLAAHYDSVDTAPGAGDDGSGVATIFETMRAIEAGPRLRNDVVVLITDGEENGLLGARAAAIHDPWLRDAGVLFNFEGGGNTGPSVLFETSDGNHGLLRRVAEAAPYPSGSSLFYTLYKMSDHDTDFTVFRQLGVAGLNFAFSRRSEAYHTALDTPANLDPASLQHDGSYAVALTRAFGNDDLKRFPLHDSQDEVFFDWFGMHLVHYPLRWVSPLTGIATVLLLSLVVASLRCRVLTLRALLSGIVVALTVLFSTAVSLAALFWCIDRAFGARLLIGDTPSNTLLFASLVLFGLAVAVGLFQFFRARWSLSSLVAGGLLLIWALTVAMTVLLPTGSYLFFWPLVFATLALSWRHVVSSRAEGSGLNQRRMPAVAAWAASIPTILLFAPIMYALFNGLHLDTTLAMQGLLLGIGCLLLFPLFDLLLPLQGGARVAALLAVCSPCFAVAGIVLSSPSAQHPTHDTLVYSIDRDKRSAQWVSFDKSPDVWTAQQLTRSPSHGKFESFWDTQTEVLWKDAGAHRVSHRVAEAPIAVSSLENGSRTVRLQLEVPPDDRWVRLRFAADSQILSATIDDEVTPMPAASEADRKFQVIDLRGYEDQTIALTMRVRSQSCQLTVSDHFAGLPSAVSARPPDRTAWPGSDYTIVVHHLTFCPP